MGADIRRYEEPDSGSEGDSLRLYRLLGREHRPDNPGDWYAARARWGHIQSLSALSGSAGIDEIAVGSRASLHCGGHAERNRDWICDVDGRLDVRPGRRDEYGCNE